MANLEELLKELAPLVEQYQKNQVKRMETGFNLFYLISDHYYRETFHRDIIGAFLSPSEKHGGDRNYLNKFIEMINECLNKENKKSIEFKYYLEPRVTLELPTDDGIFKGRIDIFVDGGTIDGEKHCIVIENKLNNAGDTEQQLPKYSRCLKGKGYIIDAFVYLPLDPHKTPDDSDWGEESDYIKERLVIIPAYKPGETNLVNDWLEKVKEYGNDDAKFVISQYMRVLNNLTIDLMDNKDIINVLKDNFETALVVYENKDAFCEAIKMEFLSALEQRVISEGYKWKSTNYRWEISNGEWLFVIEKNSNSGYWRGIENNRKIKLNNISENFFNMAESIRCDSLYPIGWDYFNSDRRYWDSISAIRDMHNGSFLNDILEEVEKAFQQMKDIYEDSL